MNLPLRSRRSLLRSLSLTLPAACALATASGCASTLPPAPPPAPVAVKPPPPPPPDVTAVPAPHDLVMFGRLSNTAASLKMATDYAHLPSLDPTTLVQGFIEGVLSSKEQSVLGTIVDPSLPIDFAATFGADIPPRALGAFSAAVKNLDAAKSALAGRYDLAPVDGGLIHLELHGKSAMSLEKPKTHRDTAACELAPAAGAAPYRLVCGSNRDALDALAPYLTRTTPRETMKADLHLEIHASPIGGFATIGRLQGPTLIGAMLGLNASAEPATSDLLTATLGDLFDYVADLDTSTFDLTLDPSQATLAMRTAYKSTTSLLAQLSTAHAERVDVPPSALWRFPADVDLASFGSGVDDAELQHPRELAVAAAMEQLAKAKMAEADRKAVAELVRDSVAGWRGVVGHGMADGSTYWLVESEAGAPQGDKLVRDMLSALGRPGVERWMKATPDGAALPTLKRGAPLAGMPAGTLHVILTVPADVPHTAGAGAKGTRAMKGDHEATTKHAAMVAEDAKSLPPQVFHVAIAPDGPRRWLAMSRSEAAVRTVLGSVASTTTSATSLGAQADARGLAGWKDAHMSSGGFLSVRFFVELARDAMGARDANKAAHFDALLRGLPAKGTTPILMTGAPGAPSADDPGGVREGRVSIPADAIRDAVFFGMQADSP